MSSLTTRLDHGASVEQHVKIPYPAQPGFSAGVAQGLHEEG
jgi:hypothetical protein